MLCQMEDGSFHGILVYFTAWCFGIPPSFTLFLQNRIFFTYFSVRGTHVILNPASEAPLGTSIEAHVASSTAATSSRASNSDQGGISDAAIVFATVAALAVLLVVTTGLVMLIRGSSSQTTESWRQHYSSAFLLYPTCYISGICLFGNSDSGAHSST